METLTRNYLVKLGVAISLNTDTNLEEIQKIDDVENFAIEAGLPILPTSLKSDDEAHNVVINISDITLDDDTITTDMREIIIEDCWTFLANY